MVDPDDVVPLWLPEPVVVDPDGAVPPWLPTPVACQPPISPGCGPVRMPAASPWQVVDWSVAPLKAIVWLPERVTSKSMARPVTPPVAGCAAPPVGVKVAWVKMPFAPKENCRVPS